LFSRMRSAMGSSRRFTTLLLRPGAAGHSAGASLWAISRL
jgi:hypothetical protein